MNAPPRRIEAAVLVLACTVLGSCGTAPDNTAGDSDVVTVANAVPRNVELVELHASWNRACRMQEPVTKALTAEFQGKATIKRIDTEADPEALKRFGIESGPPAFAVIIDGTVKQRMSGLQSAGELRAALTEALGGD